jgi:pimeloyl-ACP methyl ester carboxylesterase
MNKSMKKIGKGVLWGVGGLLTTILTTVGGWIVYSKKYINHNMPLSEALDAKRKNFQSKRAGRLSYYVHDAGEGRPLVLLHSINAAASTHEIKPIFEHYQGKRPVYALDLPGYGFSERSSRIYNPQLFQNAISEFLADIVGQPADVVALSLTCEFAALTAVHHPELIHALVMISPTGFNMPKTSKLSERLGRKNTNDAAYSGLAISLWNRPLFDLITTRPSISFFLNKSFEGLVPQSFVDHAYETAHQPGAQFAPTYFLSGKLFTPAVRQTVYNVVETPVLMIYDRDAFTRFDMLPKFLQDNENWQAAQISPTKGLPHWEKPEATFQAIDAFLT